MSPFLMNLAACFIVIFINKGLKEYDGDLAIGAFGIVNRIVFLFVMIVMGLNQGMQPIAGYNFGARQYHRVNQVLKLTIYGATLVTTSGFLVGELMPELAVSAFTTHEGLIERSATGLRIVVMFFPLSVFRWLLPTFPKYRNGIQGYLPVPYPPIAFPVTLHHYFTHVLGFKRNMDEHADFRLGSQHRGSRHALSAISDFKSHAQKQVSN